MAWGSQFFLCVSPWPHMSSNNQISNPVIGKWGNLQRPSRWCCICLVTSRFHLSHWRSYSSPLIWYRHASFKGLWTLRCAWSWNLSGLGLSISSMFNKITALTEFVLCSHYCISTTRSSYFWENRTSTATTGRHRWPPSRSNIPGS